MPVKSDVYLKYALSEIPRILGLVDRNPFSKTYGCFDRNYWHYKIIDFPSGMNQAYVLALALVYKNRLKDNPYFNVKRIKELVVAGIDFMIRSSHRDGSCDDYYPYERALGATSFSLYAATEAYMVLGLDDKRFRDFFIKRGRWILKNDEPVPLANHQAGTALALYNVYLITKDKTFLAAARKRVRRTISLQSPEGWFQEYGGCDPGYLTATIDFLSKYFIKSGDKSVLKPIDKAIRFASFFVHPDGSYAGEYGSRGTFDYLPAGFEIMRSSSIPAGKIADVCLEGIKDKKHAFMNDEKSAHIFAYNFIQAYLTRKNAKTVRETGGIGERFSGKDFLREFRDARIAVMRKGDYYLVVSYAKGGVLKLFKKGRLVLSDTGYIARTGKYLLTNQGLGTNRIKVKSDAESIDVNINSDFSKVNLRTMGIKDMVLFRLFLLLFGRFRFTSFFVKRLLTSIMITKRKTLPVVCQRSISVGKKVWIKDRIVLSGDRRIDRLALTTDFVSAHVPLTKFYQDGSLRSWNDLSGYLDELNSKGSVIIERSF